MQKRVRWKTANGFSEGTAIGEITYYNVSFGGGKTMLVDKSKCEICDTSELTRERTEG